MTFPPGLVAIPAQDMVYVPFVSSLMGLRLPSGSEVRFGLGSSGITPKRNELARYFLKRASLKWLLWLDSDHTFHPDTLLHLLGHGLPCVGALAFFRSPPYLPAALSAPGQQLSRVDGTVQKVFATGTGCLLVQRRVMEAVPLPHFRDGEEPGRGEDVHFCQQVQKAGFTVHCDTAVNIGHLGMTEVDMDFALAWQELRRAKG